MMYPIKTTPNPGAVIEEAHLLLRMVPIVTPTMDFVVEVRGTMAMTHTEDEAFRGLLRKIGVEPAETPYVDEIPAIPPHRRRMFLYLLLKMAAAAQAYHVARESGPSPGVLWPRPLLDYFPSEIEALHVI